MPVAIIGVLWSSVSFAVMTALVCLVMLFEWSRMSDRTHARGLTMLFGAGAVVAIAATLAGSNVNALFAIAIASAAGVLWSFFKSKSGMSSALRPAAGAAYISLACCAIVWMRGLSNGAEIVLTLMILVWAADTGAYVLGVMIGGPKFLPQISPNKTWAGILGGMAAAGVVSIVASRIWFPDVSEGAAVAIGGVTAFASQLGDAFESAMKRKFGVKDSSGLIPGHGGALDRLDGLILATLALTPVMHVYVAAG